MPWNPIFRSQLEDEQFKILTPIDKIFYWYLASEFNLWGELVCSDLKASQALSVSLPKIRATRRKFQKNGWIDVQSGFIKGERKFATKYRKVEWSIPSKRLKKQFVKMDRQVFESLLDLIRRKILTHADVVVLICLHYWKNLLNGWGVQGNRGAEEFFITKKKLRELTGIRDCAKIVAGLYEKAIFAGGIHLFQYVDNHSTFNFTEWLVKPGGQEDNEEKHNSAW
jgi:hypothetical protein